MTETDEQRKEEVKKRNREYYKQHKEELIKNSVEWRKNNPEKNKQWAQQYRKKKPLHAVLRVIKSKAKKQGIPFDLTIEYLEQIKTSHCPVTLEPLHYDGGRLRQNTASVDRLVPSRGYVQGNVIFVSMRANRIKNDGTLEELTRWVEILQGNQ